VLRVKTSVRRRALFVALLATGLSAIATPASADSPPSVGAARQSVAQAAQQAQQARTALGAAQQQLAGAQQQLAATQARVTSLDQAVVADGTRVVQLDQQVSVDRTELAAYLRAVYKSGGNEGALTYIIGASSLGDAFQRIGEMDRVNQAGRILLARIGAARIAAHEALDAATAARTQAEAARQQAATAEVVVSVETDQLTSASAAADTSLTTAQHQLTAAEAAAAKQAAAARAAAQAEASRARSIGTVFTPIPGPTFTVDTDLTLPSGESATKLDSFLSGTALAGLGASFMNAEHTYHVSARYFVAIAINESAWGTSAIARDKHNLFGYGADDANPYNDAVSFPTFDACIQFVAQKLAQDYLAPSGRFYHGPTPRGVGVDYASDPLWATKIARIANSIPD
jgi:beta-N-acetylglucosaminidase